MNIRSACSRIGRALNSAIAWSAYFGALILILWVLGEVLSPFAPLISALVVFSLSILMNQNGYGKPAIAGFILYSASWLMLGFPRFPHWAATVTCCIGVLIWSWGLGQTFRSFSEPFGNPA